MKTMKNLFLLSFSLLFLISCSSDDSSEPAPNPTAAYEKGILVTNEGPFNNGSGTVTYISNDYATVDQNIFRKVNGMDLGNIVQSMGFADDLAYIVVSNSQKIMVVDRYSFERKDSITTDLENPRYFMSTAGSKGYVTDWGDPFDNSDDYVALMDLRTNTVVSKISVAFGPEKMVSHNNKVYVAHQGAFSQNNLISVISGASVESTITVGDVPNSMVIIGNNLYVLCGGNPDYSGNETPGTLVKIDLSTNQVSQTFSFSATQHPSSLAADGNNLYFNLDGKVYQVDSNSINLPGTAIIQGSFYTLEGRNGKLYASDAGDFASRGRLVIYDLSSNQQIQEFQVGIVPGGIYFND